MRPAIAAFHTLGSALSAVHVMALRTSCHVPERVRRCCLTVEIERCVTILKQLKCTLNGVIMFVVQGETSPAPALRLSRGPGGPEARAAGVHMECKARKPQKAKQ